MKGNTVMSSYKDLRTKATTSVEDDVRMPLVQQEVRIKAALERIVENDDIPVPTRTAVLDKVESDLDAVGEANYSNRGGLALRPNGGGLSLFAGGNASNDPVLQSLQAVAEHTGLSPEQLVAMFNPLLRLNQGDPQIRARLMASNGVLRAADGYEVKGDATLVKAAEFAGLTNEFDEYKRDHPDQPTITTVTAHPLDGVRAKFDRLTLPDARKTNVVNALDQIVSHPDTFVATDGTIIGADAAPYRDALNWILSKTEVDKELELKDGIIGSRKEKFTIVDRTDIPEATQRFVHWIR